MTKLAGVRALIPSVKIEALEAGKVMNELFSLFHCSVTNVSRYLRYNIGTYNVKK